MPRYKGRKHNKVDIGPFRRFSRRHITFLKAAAESRGYKRGINHGWADALATFRRIEKIAAPHHRNRKIS